MQYNYNHFLHHLFVLFFIFNVSVFQITLIHLKCIATQLSHVKLTCLTVAPFHYIFLLPFSYFFLIASVVIFFCLNHGLASKYFNGLITTLSPKQNDIQLTRHTVLSPSCSCCTYL